MWLLKLGGVRDSLHNSLFLNFIHTHPYLSVSFRIYIFSFYRYHYEYHHNTDHVTNTLNKEKLPNSIEQAEIMRGQSGTNLSVDSSLGNAETIPLIRRIRSQSTVTSLPERLRYRYRTTRKCITSKAGLLVLLWSFAVALAYSVLLNGDTYLQSTALFLRSTNYAIPSPDIFVRLTLLPYGFITVAELFYPLAGFLADTKYGRYKTIVTSSYIIMPPMILFSLVAGLLTISSFIVQTVTPFSVAIALLCILSASSSFGMVGFIANVLQFGMDQLHDSPGEDQSIFIHWYVWAFYFSVFIIQGIWSLILSWDVESTHICGSVLLTLLPLLVTVLLIVTLCVAHHRRRWFLIEPGKVNPYKLVYKVTKFAFQHKIPVRRSAFTYCEDELPSGLDLGKKKYGGPFTTEEVEMSRLYMEYSKYSSVLGQCFSWTL